MLCLLIWTGEPPFGWYPWPKFKGVADDPQVSFLWGGS